MSWFGGKKKEKQKEYSGFPGDCSEEQLEVLAKFKIHVKVNNKVPIDQFDDVYLLRFLRARKFDLQKTIKMWDDFIDWRVKNKIDDCRNFKFPALPQLRKMYPHGYHKVDKQFRPVYIQRVGFMEVDKIFKVMQTEDMLHYYALLYESLLTTIFDGCTKAKAMVTGEHNRVTQTVTILDLKHVKLGNASKAYDFVKPVSAMAQNNYPEILGNMFIINAPMLFTGIWAIVKMWIDDKTKEKIKILGSSYKKQLLELIDPENLPAFLDGGKCTCGGKECKLQANVGPWNPQGKQMFEENINMNLPQNKQGYHKQQVLLSSPDVLVEVEVKNDQKQQIPPVVTLSMQHGAQQDQVLKKVAEIDMGKDEQKEDKKPEQPQKQTIESEATQTEPVKIVEINEEKTNQKNAEEQAIEAKAEEKQSKQKIEDKKAEQKISEKIEQKVYSQQTASVEKKQESQQNHGVIQ